MNEEAADPIDDLEHGHAELSALILELRSVLSRVEAGELRAADVAGELVDAAEATTHAMAIHFSREAEALFPFVGLRMPSMLARTDALAADHDSVCKHSEELTRACRRLGAGGDVAAVTEAASKLEVVYAAHASNELAFLEELRGALDAEGRRELRELLVGL